MGIFCQVFKSELKTSLYGKSSFIFENILKFVSANRLKYREYEVPLDIIREA